MDLKIACQFCLLVDGSRVCDTFKTCLKLVHGQKNVSTDKKLCPKVVYMLLSVDTETHTDYNVLRRYGMFKQLTQEIREQRLKALEEAEGIICINPKDYIMVHKANLIWQCPNGHQWQSRWSNIFNSKSRCPECYHKAFLISGTTKYKYKRCSSCKHQHRSIAQYPCVSCTENGKPDYFDLEAQQ